MKNLRFVLLGAALVGVLAATASAETPKTITIKMVAQNNSGENGTAVLTQVADGTKVEVKLDGQPKDVAQPTHIHVGNCGNINKAPEYPLTATTNADRSIFSPSDRASGRSNSSGPWTVKL